MTVLARLALPAGSAAAGIAVGLLIVAAAGARPDVALGILLAESLEPSRLAGPTLTNAIPLALAGLGAAVAARAGLFNLGGDGQLLAAALATNLVLVAVADVPAWLALPLGVAAGSALGALVAGVAGLLRVRRDVSEVVATIMLNILVAGVVTALVRGPLLAPGAAFPQTLRTPPAFDRPSIAGIDLGVPLCVSLAGGIWLLLYRSRAGLRFRAVGDNPVAAAVGGLAVARTQLAAMLASGALMGLAGVYELLAVQHRVAPGFTTGTGFTALLVAFLARSDPLAILPAALFMGALDTGGPALSRQLGVPSATIFVMQATAALMAICLPWVRLGLSRRTTRSAVPADG